MEDDDNELVMWIECAINRYFDGFETVVREGFIEELLIGSKNPR